MNTEWEKGMLAIVLTKKDAIIITWSAQAGTAHVGGYICVDLACYQFP